MQAVILMGGMATRLRPLTDEIPKSLVPINGVPFLELQLRVLARNGIRDLLFCVGHLGEMIHSRFGDGSGHGFSIAYSFDGPQPLGTAGALKRAEARLESEFLVIYGDSYLDTDYRPIIDHFHRHRPAALMTVYPNRDTRVPNNAVFSDGQLLLYDKRTPSPAMEHVDYGLAILTRGVIEELPGEVPIDLADLYHRLVNEKRMVGYEVLERFYEIGTPEGIAELERHLAGR